MPNPTTQPEIEPVPDLFAIRLAGDFEGFRREVLAEWQTELMRRCRAEVVDYESARALSNQIIESIIDRRLADDVKLIFFASGVEQKHLNPQNHEAMCAAVQRVEKRIAAMKDDLIKRIMER